VYINDVLIERTVFFRS